MEKRDEKKPMSPESRKIVDAAKDLIRKGKTEFSPLLEDAAAIAERELKKEARKP